MRSDAVAVKIKNRVPLTRKEGEETMLQLKDTIEMMIDENYKTRFKAEYFQTKIRYEKLHSMLVKHEAGTLPFKPSCPIEVLERQAKHMGEYLKDLEIRAEIEGIY